MASVAVPSGNDMSTAATTANDGSNNTTKKPNSSEPRLLHPFLLSVPTQIRFGIQGVVSNVLFMIVYNHFVDRYQHVYDAAAVYAVVYFFYIPVGHLLSSLLVFGWPTGQYIRNLMNNYPIGLTSIVIGSGCTAYLDHIQFNEKMERFVQNNLAFLVGAEQPPVGEEETGSEFYSSLFVIIITGGWVYVLSAIVNTPKEDTTSEEKKEL